MNDIDTIKIIDKIIHEVNNMTEKDSAVLSVVNSFWACSDAYIKANLASRLVKYVGCKT